VLRGAIDNVPRFALRDGVVRTENGDGDFVRPGVFLLLRPWPSKWLWLGLGGTTGEDLAKPDQFVGLVARLGGSLAKRSFTVGVGYIRSAVASSLDGVSDGQPLPAGVDDLQKITVLKYKGGIGLLLSLSGLELKGKE
jgi:hypothetical protein